VTRKRERRQLVRPERPDLEHLGARADLFPVDQHAAIRDADDRRRARLGDVIHAEQLLERDTGADLFAALAHRRSGGILVVVDEAAR
jgi:hypothetical protein